MLKNTIPARIDFNIDNLPQKSTIDEIISFTYVKMTLPGMLSFTLSTQLEGK